MDKAEALRAIHLDQLEYIQQKVAVTFDNRRQKPLSFHFRGRTYAVEDVVCRCRTDLERATSGYLVRVGEQEVFYLYMQAERPACPSSVEPAFWVLSFRIHKRYELMSWFIEERTMLANISLKRVVDFHGHICPELAVGGKFCEFVQTLINNGDIPTGGISILAENTTSALDAIQVLLGTTVGNRRLAVMDFGKHNYTVFSRPANRGWRLRRRVLRFGDEENFQALEEKVGKNLAMIEDVVQLQQLLDARVRRLLELTPEELFLIEEVAPSPPPPETASTYLICSACGEQVLAGHSITSRDTVLCLPCYQKMAPEVSSLAIH